jgi:simple sugar transport system ATP-binding protein
VGSKLKSPKKSKSNFGAAILEVNNLSLKSLDPFGTSLKNITFNLRAGEVMGVAGVAGNGQDELMLALSGETLTSTNSIKLEDKYIGQSNPVQRRLLGLLTAPEERLGHAAAPEMSLAENTLLSGFQRQKLGRRGFLNKPGAIAFAEKIVQQFDVRTPSVRNGARSLSGGNLQKFVIGREILQNPRVFVVNQPTWGVDAAAAAFIRQALLELAEGGAGVLVISQDLDELMEISDSFMVLSEGEISTPRPAKGMTTEAIGLMMGGTKVA